MTSKKQLVDLDLNGNELQNAVIQNLATAPNNPKKGQEYFNTTDNKKYIFNGFEWMDETNQGKIYTEGEGISINNTTISIDETVVAKKVELPTVNNSTLTIQKNSSTIDSVSLNTPADKTINITVPTTVAELTDAANYALKSDISSAIIPKGSVASVSDLPAPSSATLGNMYNFTAEFETTSDFIEGQGKKYPIGTNVVVVEAGTEIYKYDVFSGFINTSLFVTNTDIANNLNAGITKIYSTTGSNTDGTMTQSAICNSLERKTGKFTATNPILTANSGICTWTITNELNSSDIQVIVKETSSNKEVVADITTTDNTITVKLNSANNIQENSYKVVVIG